MAKTVIPFGPQHPVLPEPIQLKLVVEDDIIVEALPSIGYVHRGLEKLAELKDFNQMTYVAERICGICSYMHSVAYVKGIEEIMDIQIPERADYIRVILSEMSRLQSHFLWLGLLADSFGFESLFMEIWKYRETILDIMEMTCGNRVIHSANKVGGVTHDLTDEHIKFILSSVDRLEKEMKQSETVFSDNYTVKKRTIGVGVLTHEDAVAYSVVGPVARASGIKLDYRETGYSAYKHLDFEPIIEKDGDCYARAIIRIKEVHQSFALIRQAIQKMPKGEISVPVKGFPKGEVISRIEQPRGEALI